MKKKRSYILAAAALIAVFVIATSTETSIPALSKIGSQGEEVTLIQKFLLAKGLYSGAADGIFGEKTRAAVVEYQRQNGLTADGIAGTQTLLKMKADPQWPGTAGAGGSTGGDYVIGFTEYEKNLLAKVVNGEARGEPYEGQVAVGAVIVNRARHPSFPNTIASVIYQPGAFSSIVDGQANAALYESSKRAAEDALLGVDPTGGAVYFFNPAKTSNQFMHSLTVSLRIGSHAFAQYQ